MRIVRMLLLAAVLVSIGFLWVRLLRGGSELYGTAGLTAFGVGTVRVVSGQQRKSLGHWLLTSTVLLIYGLLFCWTLRLA